MTKDQLKQLEADLWSAADNLRANSDLKSSEYSTPVLGLIFLKFADNNYRRHEAEIVAEYQKLKGTRREKTLSEIAIEKQRRRPPLDEPEVALTVRNLASLKWLQVKPSTDLPLPDEFAIDRL